ncbi:MAG TPA: homoserine dehydrogenase [Candidatus Brocadiia bacterium]|mgnify:CR=1 FL=1|nr:homoserine dehydrogenase [Candidatus Brocadiia bacterium]
MPRDSIKVGVVGCGVVGAGVVKMLRRKRAAIRQMSGADIEIVRAVDKDPKRLASLDLPKSCLSADMSAVLEDPDIRVVVELIGGKGAARELVFAALSRGKNVVTANKALLSAFWPQIFTLSRKTGARIQFEASVMAGVPIIRGLHEGLVGNTVTSMTGILNGTTNFILTRMSQRGLHFAKAVEEARKRGLCEADPTLDVDGFDAAHKLAILGSLASGRWLPPEAVHTEGIRHIEPCDIAWGRQELGCDLKLLAIYKRQGSQVDARVHPAFVPSGHPLAAVRDEFNAAYIESDAAGPVMLYGKGAGQMPAASGVVSDVIALAVEGAGAHARIPAGFEKDPIRPIPLEDVESHFYLRFSTVDRPGVLAAITGALGAQSVSLATCVQRGRAAQGPVAIVVTTHRCREGALRKALEKIDSMKDIICRKTILIRMLDS